MRSQDKVIFFLLIILIFLEGLWLAKILAFMSEVLEAYGHESPLKWVSNTFSFITQKTPTIAANLTQLVWAFVHLFVSIFALKLYFLWKAKYFFKFFFTAYSYFLIISLSLIFAYAAQAKFFKVWEDFMSLFFSPFPLIFLFLVLKLTNKK